MGLEFRPHTKHIVEYGQPFHYLVYQVFLDDLQEAGTQYHVEENDGGSESFEMASNELEGYLEVRRENPDEILKQHRAFNGVIVITAKDVIEMCEYMLAHAVTEDGWIHASLF